MIRSDKSKFKYELDQMRGVRTWRYPASYRSLYGYFVFLVLTKVEALVAQT